MTTTLSEQIGPILTAADQTIAALTQAVTDRDQEIADLTSENAELKAKLEPPAPPFALGMAYESNTDPAPVEKRLGRPVDSRRAYLGGSTAEADKAAAIGKADKAAGRDVSSVSFKPPLSWADMAAGKGDPWVAGVTRRLLATGQSFRLAVGHEPENDKTPNFGNTAAGRDNWLAMQNRLAGLFDVEGIEYIAILMGMHSTRSADSLYPLWRLDKGVPTSPSLKGVGYDLYQYRGRVQSGHTTADGWSPLAKDLDAIAAFHKTRPGLKWGLSEHAHTEAAEAERPGLLDATVADVIAHGGSWLEWFNSNLNSTAAWEMTPGSAREKSYATVLANRSR